MKHGEILKRLKSTVWWWNTLKDPGVWLE